MNAALLKVYHHLPPTVRSLAATWHGRSLQAWRYGPETERLVQAAFEREQWSAAQWGAWREERLGRILHRAANEVPYYRRHWKERRRRGDRSSPEELGNWPVLEKEALRAEPQAFLAEGRDPRSMTRLHTSGTSGAPLDLWATQSTERQWWALFDARWRRRYGVTRRDRWATIGGKIVTPIGQRRPPFWVWDAAQSLLYMSTYHLAPDLTPSYLDALKRHRVRYLRGYASSLYSLAQDALRLGRRDLKMEVAVMYAEPLYPHQREAIEEAFGCPVRESYGMVEMTAAASECEAGRLHLWPEAGWYEVVDEQDEDRLVANGSSGALLATGLLNEEMPLIRYRVGDSVALPAEETPCPCGRTLPQLASVDGRLDDVVYTLDGRRIGCLDVVHAGMPVREAQVVQESAGCVRVLYVPAPGFTQAAGREIAGEIRGQMGAVEVILERVERVPRGANGKFRMVVCRIPAEERERLPLGSRSPRTPAYGVAAAERAAEARR